MGEITESAGGKDNAVGKPIGVWPRAGSAPSLLERLMNLIEENTRLRINFEDVSGITLDIPDLHLSPHFCVHTCTFCVFAQSQAKGHLDCQKNKIAANRVAFARRAGFTGQCHLGLTDIVKPLIAGDHVLGVFYLGSVVVEGTQDVARTRIRKYCRRRNLDPDPFFQRLNAAVTISKDDVTKYERQIDDIAAFARYILDTYGEPFDRYAPEAGRHLVDPHRRLPLVQQAMRLIYELSGDSLEVRDLASRLRCHPDYLSRMFRRETGYTVRDYIARVRIDHARRLMATKAHSLSEIASLCGFGDQSHFSRVFMRFVGIRPSKYQPNTNDLALGFAETMEKFPSSMSQEAHQIDPIRESDPC